MSISVVVADDQALVRGGFRMILDARDDIEVVGRGRRRRGGRRAGRAPAARRRADGRAHARDGRHRGDPAHRRFRQPHPLVVLTTYDLDEYVFAAVRAGASGFLLKDVRPADLADAVRVVAGGEALLAPSATRRLLDRFAGTLPDPGPTPEALEELTERELEVLRLVALALSNAEIAKRLVLTEATVKTHVSAVLRKLGLRDRVQAVVHRL